MGVTQNILKDNIYGTFVQRDKTIIKQLALDKKKKNETAKGKGKKNRRTINNKEIKETIENSYFDQLFFGVTD